MVATEPADEGEDVVCGPNDVEVSVNAIGLGPSDLAPGGDQALGVEHVLLGLLRDAQGGAVGALGALGIVPSDVEEALEAALGPAAD